MDKIEFKFLYDLLEEARWRIKGLLKTCEAKESVFPKNFKKKITKIHSDICDVEEKLEKHYKEEEK